MRGIALALVAMIAAPMAMPQVAHADRLAEFERVLTKSSNSKERIAAVTALSRLSDKRVLKPLVAALADPNPSVRTIAAAALGKLSHKASIPALRSATQDADVTVARTASEALAKVSRANGIELEPAVATVPARAGFGNKPRAVASRPDLYVVIKTSADDSPGKPDVRARKQHAEHVKTAMVSALKAAPAVTSVASEAARFDLPAHQLDLSVVKLEHRVVGGKVEIEAQLRLAISDAKGKMMSFVSGGAMVQVPKKSFDARYLPQLRKEAIDNAVNGLFDKLLSHMRRSPQS